MVNVVLVVLDTARRDVFEPYGGATGSTPVVREMSTRGSAHPAMYSPASWTVPAHAGLFGGALPRSLGLDHRGGADATDFRTMLRAQADRLLPEVLRRAGWATSGISANGWIGEPSGFDTGFERWRSVRHVRSQWLASDHPKDRARWYLAALRAHLDDGAAAVEDELRGWLRSRDHRPFFWFVNLVECHSPYLPPRPYTTYGPLGRLASAHDARTHQTFEQFWRASLAGWDATEAVRERIRRQYLSSIALLDDWVGRLLQLLDSGRLLDDTVVIVTSDHGENLGENDLFGHAFSLDDRLIRVPFFQTGPVRLSLPAVAQLDDVPCALADAVGLTDHPWTRRADAGVAVAQFDAPGTRGDAKTEEVIRDWKLDARATERLCASFMVATDGRWKLWRNDAGVELLLDLAADPLERAAIPPGRVPDEPSALPLLRDALDRATVAARPRPATVDEASAPDVDTDALEQQLRALGYL